MDINTLPLLHFIWLKKVKNNAIVGQKTNVWLQLEKLQEVKKIQ